MVNTGESKQAYKLFIMSAEGGNRTRTPVARPRILSPFQNLRILQQLRLIAAYQQFSFGFPLLDFRYIRTNSL
jgi:hypothetical protein